MTMSCSEAVLKYMEETNRPYSVNDVTLNLHKEYGKSAVQKALEEAAEKGLLREKTYGKQKVYCFLQRGESGKKEEGGDGEEKGEDLDEEIRIKNESLSILEEEYKKQESLLKKLLSEPKTDEAIQDNQRLKESNEALEIKYKTLSEFKDEKPLVSKEDFDGYRKEKERMGKEYKKRKRIVDEMISTVLEGGYPKNKKSLFEEIGIETDQDAGFSILL